jgi:hypothetical protein
MKYLVITFYLFNLLSCKKNKQESELIPCIDKINDSLEYVCLNKVYKNNIDGSYEAGAIKLKPLNGVWFQFYFYKQYYYGSHMSTSLYCTLGMNNVPTGEVSKFFIDTNLVGNKRNLQCVNQNYFLDKNNTNWDWEQYNYDPNIKLIYSYYDYKKIGLLDSFSYGPIDSGMRYIPFRLFDQSNGIEGWKNGWIRINCMKEKCIIYDIVYSKFAETPIIVGKYY